MTVIYASDNDGGDPRETTTRYNTDNSWRDEIAEFADAVLTGNDIVAVSYTHLTLPTILLV